MSHSTATTESWVRIHHDLRSPNTDTYRIYSPDSDHHGQIRGHSNNDIVQYENGKQSRPQTPFYRHSQVYSSPVRLDTIRQCGHTNNNGCENSPRRDGPDPEGSASGEWLPYDSWERPSHVTGQSRNMWCHLSAESERRDNSPGSLTYVPPAPPSQPLPPPPPLPPSSLPLLKLPPPLPPYLHGIRHDDYYKSEG